MAKFGIGLATVILLVMLLQETASISGQSTKVIELPNGEQRCFRILADGAGQWGDCDAERKEHRPASSLSRSTLMRKMASSSGGDEVNGAQVPLVQLSPTDWVQRTHDDRPWIVLVVKGECDVACETAKKEFTAAALHMSHCMGFGILTADASPAHSTLAEHHLHISNYPTLIRLAPRSPSTTVTTPTSRHASSPAATITPIRAEKLSVIALKGRFYRSLGTGGAWGEGGMVEVVRDDTSETGWRDVGDGGGGGGGLDDKSVMEEDHVSHDARVRHEEKNKKDDDDHMAVFTKEAQRMHVLQLWPEQRPKGNVTNDNAVMEFCAHYLEGTGVQHLHTIEQMTAFMASDIHFLKVMLFDDEHSSALGALQLFVHGLASHDLQVAHACSDTAQLMATRLGVVPPALVVNEYPFDSPHILRELPFTAESIHAFVDSARTVLVSQM